MSSINHQGTGVGGDGTMTAAEPGSGRNLHPASAPCARAAPGDTAGSKDSAAGPGAAPGVQLARGLCLLLAQEPVTPLDVPEAELLHPGYGRSPAPASSPNCLGAEGRGPQHPKAPWGNSSSPALCMAQSQHKTSHGETTSSSWGTLRGALCSVGVAPGHADTTLPHCPKAAAPGTQPGLAGKLRASRRMWARFPCPDQAGAAPCSQPGAGTGGEGASPSP